VACKAGEAEARQSWLTRLEQAAQAGDERAFVAIYQETGQEQGFSAGDFVYLIRLALEAGAPVLAREIALRSACGYPNDLELQKYAAVLAPPKQLAATHHTKQDCEANRRWLKQYGSTYRDQWVALRDGQLLGAAPSPKQLSEEIGDLSNVFLTIAY
jgi:hypothetical protein